MGDLSTNFSRYEFQCDCGCGQDTVDAELIDIVQKVRDHFGAVVTVTSGNRCVSYNHRVGGSVRSQHLHGRAADIVVDGVAPEYVADYIETIMSGRGGLGRYPYFTHVDTRTGYARWGNNAS